MIHSIKEGDPSGYGLNYMAVSDGGFAIVLNLYVAIWYFRVRGRHNQVKPRAYMAFDWRN